MIWLIGLAGMAGTLARFYVGKRMQALTGNRFPWGTWLINLTGSYVLGLLFGLHAEHRIPEWAWLAFGIGFCGAYTTFSTFGYETLQLLTNRQPGRAVFYVLGSVVPGVLLAWLGLETVG